MKNVSKKSIRNALAIVLCAITVILSLCSCSSDKKGSKEAENNSSAVETIGKVKELHLDDYVDIEYKSMSSSVEKLYSGYVEPEIVIDYEKLGNDIGTDGMKNYYKIIKGLTDEEAQNNANGVGYYPASAIFTIELKESYQNLFNGDTVTVELNLQSSDSFEAAIAAMGISIEKEIDITVEGLENAKELDLMGSVESYLKYSGGNGDTTAEIDLSEVNDTAVLYDEIYVNIVHGFDDFYSVVYNNEEIGTFYYYVKNSKDEDNKILTSYATVKSLSNGDVLTVKLCSGDSLWVNLLNLGYIPNEFEKEITVSGRGEYVKTKDELTSDDLEKIKQDVFETLCKKYSDVEICSANFATIKPGEACELSEKTEIHFVCATTFISTRSYSCYKVNGISRNESGELEYTLVSSNYGYEATAQDMESKLDSAYTYEKLF